MVVGRRGGGGQRAACYPQLRGVGAEISRRGWRDAGPDPSLSTSSEPPGPRPCSVSPRPGLPFTSASSIQRDVFTSTRTLLSLPPCARSCSIVITSLLCRFHADSSKSHHGYTREDINSASPLRPERIESYGTALTVSTTITSVPGATRTRPDPRGSCSCHRRQHSSSFPWLVLRALSDIPGLEHKVRPSARRPCSVYIQRAYHLSRNPRISDP